MEPRKATVIPESMGLSRTIQHGVEKMGEEATSQQSSKTPAKKRGKFSNSHRRNRGATLGTLQVKWYVQIFQFV